MKKNKTRDKNKESIFKRIDSSGYILFFVFVCCGIIYWIANGSGYVDCNPDIAYNLWEPKQWLGFLVAVLGGLHLYDLILPLALVAGYLYICFSSRDENGNKGKRKHSRRTRNSTNDDWKLSWFNLRISKRFRNNVYYIGIVLLFCGALRWLAVVYLIVILYDDELTISELIKKQFQKICFPFLFLLIVMPLRILYFPLFLINCYTVDEKQTKEILITDGKSDVYHVYSTHIKYELIVDLGNGVPYQIKVSKDDFDKYKTGQVKKVLVDVCQGDLGFLFADGYKIVTAQKDHVRLHILPASEKGKPELYQNRKLEKMK